MEWRSGIRKINAPEAQATIGVRRLIEDITIVKPKIERMHAIVVNQTSKKKEAPRDFETLEASMPQAG